MGILETLLQRVGSLSKSGSAKLVGDVTLSAGSNITLTQAANDIEIAVSGSSGGPPAALLWDTTQATDAAEGRYATYAEVDAAIGTAESPIDLEIKGTCLVDVSGTKEWANVRVVGNDDTATLEFDEGAVWRNVEIAAPIAISTTATTTRALSYTAGHQARLARATLEGNASVGLVAATHTGTLDVYVSGGATIGHNAFENAVATTTNVNMRDATFAASSGGHFKGSSGTVSVRTTTETAGTFDSTTFSGSLTREKLGAGAAAPVVDASDLVRFKLNDAAGATSISNSGAGTAFTLATRTGAGSETFGIPEPIGDALLVVGVRYFNDASSGITYQPSATNFTASCWIKFKKNPVLASAGFASFFGKINATDSTFALGVDTNTGVVKAKVGAGGVDSSLSSPMASAAGEWYHVALTYDGADMRLYVNGVQMATAAKTGTLDWDNTKSWVVGNSGTTGEIFSICECRFANVVRAASEIKATYIEGAFTGSATLDAATLQGSAIDTSAPSAGDALVYDGSAWVPTALPTRGVVASLEWTATAGVYTIVASQNVASVTGYDYGSGTHSLKVTLSSSVTNGIAHATADPDWVNTFHIDPAGPVMVSGTEIRVDYRNKADTQISTADGAGTLTVFGDL